MTRKALVREVNPHLICVICSGYFIEATTIVECLHSFCRSCLVKYLENCKFCPICDVQLQKNNPLLSVRCDPTLQQLVYKLIPGLYANEMARRRKYYSELGGPTSGGSEPEQFPLCDKFFSPEDSISLSLEFVTGKEKEESDSGDACQVVADKGIHRRYLQCPAAVTMSHLKKFLRMKYNLTQDFTVDVIYSGESLADDFSLMDVAYTFNWNKTTPMKFKYRFYQRPVVRAPPSGDLSKAVYVRIEEPSGAVYVRKEETESPAPRKRTEEIPREGEGKGEEPKSVPAEKPIPETKTPETGKGEPKEKEKKKEEVAEKKSVKRNGTKEGGPEPKRTRLTEPAPKAKPKVTEMEVEEEAEEEEEEEDRSRVSASEEDLTPEEKSPPLSLTPEDPSPDRGGEAEGEHRPHQRSEERRRERKKSKKGKHHHHHRHHERKARGSSPVPPARAATATILHSPENDVMKLKVKLTAVKTDCNSGVTEYSVVEGTEEKKEKREKEEVQEKAKRKEEEAPKRPAVAPPPIVHPPVRKEKAVPGARPLRQKPTTVKINGTETLKMPPSSITVSKITAEEKRKMERRKLLSSLNSAADAESKRPSLEIMLVNAPNKDTDGGSTPGHGRTSPPTKTGTNPTVTLNNNNNNTTNGNKGPETKKSIRPTPPSIPLVRLNLGLGLGRNSSDFLSRLSPTVKIPPVAVPPTPSAPNPLPRSKDREEPTLALDLSEKSSRKTPPSPAPAAASMRNLMTLSDTAVQIRNMMASSQHELKIPSYGRPLVASSDGGRPHLHSHSLTGPRPAPNQTVRQIPNPSALLFRSRGGVAGAAPRNSVPALPLSSLKSMTRNIEKVAAGLTVKAAVEAAYAAK